MSFFTTIGTWSLGVVVVFVALSLVAKAIRVGGDFIEEMSEEVQTRLGAILFTAFTAALIYLAFWGCFLVGDWLVGKVITVL